VSGNFSWGTPVKNTVFHRNKLQEYLKVETFSVSGGCLCGKVRYTVNKAASCIVHCHCSRCRKGHASLVNTCAVVGLGDLTIVKGQNLLTIFTHALGVHRKFCSICGCSILYTEKVFPDKVFYYPATLDDGVNPGHPDGSEHHIYIDSKAEWEVFETSLPWHKEDMEETNYTKERSEWANALPLNET